MMMMVVTVFRIMRMVMVLIATFMAVGMGMRMSVCQSAVFVFMGVHMIVFMNFTRFTDPDAIFLATSASTAHIFEFLVFNA